MIISCSHYLGYKALVADSGLFVWTCGIIMLFFYGTFLLMFKNMDIYQIKTKAFKKEKEKCRRFAGKLNHLETKIMPVPRLS